MNKKGVEWCIALENIGPYMNIVLGPRFMFLKGERATKEKVFNYIPEMTEEDYNKYFRPATEEEINGEFEWDGEQFILKGLKRMTQEETKNVLGHEPLTLEQMKEMQAMLLQHDWEALRNQAAISCLSAIIGTMPKEVQGNYADVYAKEAVEYADALIEELKKK